jgi:nicotinamide mononucleotide transporter
VTALAPSAAPTTARTAAPFFGRPHEHRHALVAGVGSLAACLLYTLAAHTVAPEFTPGLLEFSGTFTSLWCVWITQRRNVLSLPIGIVSVLLLGAFFVQIALPGQALLHFAYYLPVQVWGWWMWTRGGEDRSELTVTRLALPGRLALLAWVVALTGLFALLLSSWFDSAHTLWDASIVAASVVAQLLLSRKKVESWWLWIGPVNISAIGLYLVTGAAMFAALYVLFLLMALVGHARWQRAAAARSA